MNNKKAIPYQLARLLLAPVLLAQGRSVRQVALALPEAVGPRAGLSGEGAPLRLVVLGDSAAAGVGAATQEEALLGQIVAPLAQRYRVQWQLIARTGATTAGTLKHLQKSMTDRFDVAVISLGVNDVMAGQTLPAWQAQQQTLVEILRTALGVRQMIFSGLPPVHHFPALPQPLRWYLGGQVRYFDQALAAWVQTQPDCTYINLNRTFDPTWLASDKFHPGPRLYQQWGAAVAQQIQQWLQTENSTL
jgi:lysophospholipase L1-like esterase